MNIKNHVRDVPDFPKQGIIFKDITPILNNAAAFQETIKQMAKKIPDETDVLLGIESRGFIFAATLAYKLGKRFVPIRKKDKLPAAVYKQEYDLEYGTDLIEIHKDALHANDKVVIIDDLLATGGTAAAAEKLIAKCNAGLVGALFLIELDFLNGRDNLKNNNVISLIHY